MRILVTGAFGFLGTAVVARLVTAGHDIAALSRRLDAVHPVPGVEPVTGDILDRALMEKAVQGVDAVCHLAALTQVRESFARPEAYFEVNREGTRTVLEAAAARAELRGRPTRFLLASTGAVYGPADEELLNESVIPHPTSPYAESKLAAEELALGSAGEWLRPTVLRLFNIAGAVAGRGDGDSTRIIPAALAVARGENPALKVNGDGSAIRDFVHVYDAAEALLAAVNGPLPNEGRVFNVGATPASVRDIIETVEVVTGQSLPIEWQEPKPEPKRLLADTSRIRTELAWSARRSDLRSIITDAWHAASPM